MVLFEVRNSDSVMIDIVLNGVNFHYKLQEVLLGIGKYKKYITRYGDMNEWKVKVLEIDIDSNNINDTLFRAHIREGTPQQFIPIRDETIEKYYGKISIQQNLDFYLNLRDYYGVVKLKEIIHTYLYYNVSINWLSAYYKLDKGEIMFLLKYLPVYYNYLMEV